MKRLILSFLVFAAAALAQTAAFPGAVATDAQLMRLANRVQTTLTLPVAGSDTVIHVSSGARIQAPGLVTIESEIVAVCSKSGNDLTVGYSACPNIDGRGFDGTAAASHANSITVSMFVDAWHHMALSAELQAVETALGANLSHVEPANANIQAHIARTDNPHAVTKSQVGLGNVTNDAQLKAASNLADLPNAATARASLSLDQVTNDAQLKVASNLADVPNPATARANLGITSPTSSYLYPADYVWSQTPSGSVAIGFNTVTLAAGCPKGLNGSDVLHPVYLSGPSAATTLTVTSATQATPIVVGFSANHNLTTGNFIVVSGVGGAVAANGPWIVTTVDATHVSLNGSANASGAAYTSGGTAAYGPEAVMITGGTCTSGAGSGTITFTASNPHTAGYTIGTATAGGQEAIVAAVASGLRAVSFTSSVTVQAGMSLPAGDFALKGAGRSTTLTLAPGMPNVSMISAAGSASTQTSSTTALPENQRSTNPSTITINVASTAGFAAGDYVELTYQAKSLAITDATNATPIVVTFSASHNMVNGDFLVASNVSGNTAANGSWFVTVVDGTHVSLNNSAGNGAYTSGGTASLNPFKQIVLVQSVGAGSLTFQNPVMIPLRSTDANNVTRLSMAARLSISGLVLDGGGIGDGTFNTPTTTIFGLNLATFSDSLVSDIEFKNFTMSAGMITGDGHNNKFTNLTAINSGSSGYDDISVYSQSHCQAANLSSVRAYGFALGFFFDIDCQAANLSAESPRARGFKICATGWSQFTNVATHRSKTGNGTAFACGSYRNIVSNIAANANPTNEGIWFSGQNNEYNQLQGVTAFCNGIHDLFFNQSDINNSVRGIAGGSTCTGDLGDNGGVGSNNTIETASPMHSWATNSVAQSLPNNAFTPLTFNVNAALPGNATWDASGIFGTLVHSTASNTSRFTVPAGQSGTGSFAFGTFEACGQVEFAANSTGRRLLVIHKNGGGTFSGTTLRTFGATTTSAGQPTAGGCWTGPLSLGDYIEFYAYQDSGGALNTAAGAGHTDGMLVKER